MKKKIVFIGRENLKKNASTIRALGMAESLIANGYSVSLILPFDAENVELKLKYAGKISTHLSLTSFLEPFHKLYLLYKIRPQIVHCLNAGLNSSIVGLCYKILNPGIILVWDADELASELYSSSLRRTWLSINEYLSANFSDYTLTASQYLQNVFFSAFNIKATYFPYAIDPQLFSFKKLINSNKSVKKITYFGSLQSYFDFDNLLEAIKKSNTKNPNWYFTFIGDGAQMVTIKTFISDHSLQNIEMKGFLPDDQVIDELIGSDVLILPLKNNKINNSRCPNKLFWYMAAGKPIVTNFVGEVAHILGSNGIYYDFDSSDDLLEKIQIAILKGRIAYDASSITWQYRTSVYLNNVIQDN